MTSAKTALIFRGVNSVHFLGLCQPSNDTKSPTTSVLHPSRTGSAKRNKMCLRKCTNNSCILLSSPSSSHYSAHTTHRPCHRTSSTATTAMMLHQYYSLPTALLSLLSGVYAQETTAPPFSAPGPMEQSITLTASLTTTVVSTTTASSATLTALSGTRTDTSTEDTASLIPVVGTNTDAETPTSGSTTVVLTSTTGSASTSTITQTAATTTSSAAAGGVAAVMGGTVEQAFILGLGAGAAFVL